MLCQNKLLLIVKGAHMSKEFYVKSVDVDLNCASVDMDSASTPDQKSCVCGRVL